VPLAAPIPETINYIAMRLAAGFLLNVEYGSNERGEGPGDSRINEARTMLKEIQKGETTLLGAESIDLSSGSTSAATTGAGGVDGFPDENTDDLDVDEGGSERSFRMGDRY
jgi:hypothetical protein